MSAHTLTNLLGSTPPSTGAGTGDVVGPSSSTDNAIARYDSTTGKLLQTSTAILSDNGSVNFVVDANADTTVGTLRNAHAEGGATLLIQRANGGTSSYRAASVSFNGEWFAGVLRRGGSTVNFFAIGRGTDTNTTPPALEFLLDNTTTLRSATSGTTFFPLRVLATTTQGTTAGYTAFQVQVTETSVGSGTKLLMQLGTAASASLFTVSNTGAAFAALGYGHGTGVASGPVMFNSIQSVNGIVAGHIVNTNTGTSASARWVLSQADADVNNGMQLRVTSTGFTATGLFLQDAAMLLAGSGLAGGLTIGTQAAASLIFATNNTNRGSIDSSGNLSITGGSISDSLGNVRVVNPQEKSADYGIVLTDANTCIVHAVGDDNPRTFTIPANGTIAIPVGSMITFSNRINTLTIAITSDTLVWAADGTTGSRTLAAGGLATAYKVEATVWQISGAGLT